jgi:hypothetical protein
MSTNALSPTSHEGASERPIWSGNFRSGTPTEAKSIGASGSPSNVLTPQTEIETRTVTGRINGGNRIWPSTGQGHQIPAPQGAAAPTGPGINGVVLHVTNESVQNEFLHGSESTKVWLPRSLYPDDVKQGYTFTLSVEVENGFRTPRIIPRSIQATPSVNEKLANLRQRMLLD